MGLRYVAFRLWFEIKRRMGWLKKAFPTNPKEKRFISLSDWKKLDLPFFFSSRQDLNFTKRTQSTLEEEVNKMKKGTFLFFNATWHTLDKNDDGLKNPVSNYHYDIKKHWTEIPDFDPEKGDIKYVWERSRFSWLLKVVRYDYHHEKDSGEWVFTEIENWINANPINQGPNWRCSQEISLRTLNWLFALYFYKKSAALSEHRFQKIMHVIYWQLKHVHSNIHFSRIAVRNNHAITESLTLLLGGLLFPFFRESEKWKTKGKKWLETEISYQIYKDGTYLQHSMNYHRVVIQLLSWGIRLSELHKQPLSSEVYDRARQSVRFLSRCLEPTTGYLPNYGNNDGALFFPLSNNHYRDYRSQLNALSLVLGDGILYQEENSLEEANWFGVFANKSNHHLVLKKEAISSSQSFKNGGYYLFRDTDSFTFLRCAKYKDRPAQADNLHVDIWFKGENVFQDAGTYLYNGGEALLRHFWGTSAHNTLTLGAHDQMKKGSRFIWYYWSQAEEVKTEEHTDYWLFKGSIKAFQYLEKGIIHTREIKKYKNRPEWEIRDTVRHNLNLPIYQYWHPSSSCSRAFTIEAKDENDQIIEAKTTKGWYASLYGQKEESPTISFQTAGKTINTRITIK